MNPRFLALPLVLLVGCNTGENSRSEAVSAAASVAVPGFHTEVVDGRLWVFREDDPALQQFLDTGEPAKSVTRIGGGPDGMTIRSSDVETIDAYLAAR